MLGKRLEAVAACFRNGGGVPSSEFRPDFTDFMDGSRRLVYDGLLVKGFLPAVKGLPERLTAGIRVADAVRAVDVRHERVALHDGLLGRRRRRTRHRLG
jgi:hypothetical protein